MTQLQKLRKVKEEIINKYNDGIGTYRLGKEYKVGSQVIYDLLEENNVQMRKKIVPQIPKKKDLILNLWNNGDSIKKISKKTGIARQSLSGWMQKWGIDTEKYSTKREDPIVNHVEQIIEMYQDGETLDNIAQKFSAASASVRDLLLRFNVELRPNHKYEFREDFFEKIDSHEKAWVLGVIYADGCVREDRGTLALSMADFDVIDKIKNITDFDGPISFIDRKKPHHKDMYKLSLQRRKIVPDLVKLGCVQNKTHVIRFPSNDVVPYEFIDSFLRGFVDGDGCITRLHNTNTFQCYRYSWTSNKDFIEGSRQFLDKHGYRYSVSKPQSNGITKSIYISYQADIYKFGKWLYQNSTENTRMDRKYQKFQEFCKYYESTLN